MKQVAYLNLYAASLVHAYQTSASISSDGFCHLRLFPRLSSPVCSADTLVTEYLPGAGRGLANRAWTRVSSCVDNGTEEYCIFASSTFASGRGLSVLTGPERADYIAGLPAFTTPSVLQDENIDPDPDVANFRMVHVPGKGMGVVATRPFQRGDHIMSFTPAIIIDYGAFEDLAVADIEWLQADAIDSLPTALRAKFLNLSTHDGADGHLQRVDKILQTNAFDVDLQDKNANGLYVVFPEISRFNHDCRPNADYHFDSETLVQHIHATRPIQIGEEITLTYMEHLPRLTTRTAVLTVSSPIRTRAKRQTKLKRIWGFQCNCSICTQRSPMTAASDARIRHIRQIRKQLEDLTTGSSANPQMADLFVSLYQQERLDGAIYEAYMFAAIEWNGAGEPSTAVKYARLAVEHGLASVGSKNRDVIEMKKLAEDPWGHWSWMLRTSKRMSWGSMRPVGNNYIRSAGDQDDEDDD